jgi:hypothetical protein
MNIVNTNMKKNYILPVGLLGTILLVSIIYIYTVKESFILEKFMDAIKCTFKRNRVETDKSKILTDLLTDYSNKLTNKINPASETIGLWPNDEATIYVRGNMPADTERYVKNVIYTVLNDFNIKTPCNELKFIELETIIEKKLVKNMGDKPTTRYLAQFFVHDVPSKSTRKLNMQWETSTNDILSSIQFIHPEGAGEQIYNQLNRVFVHGVDTPYVEQDANTLSADLQGKYYNNYTALDAPSSLSQRYQKISPCETNDTRVESAICRNAQSTSDWNMVTNVLGYTQEPCKEEAGMNWNRHGVYDQLKPSPSCNVSHYGYKPVNPDLYDNPTIYTIPFPGENTISQTNVLPYAQDIYSYVK